MNNPSDRKKPKTRKQRIKKAFKIKLTEVTILISFISGILVCLC